MGFVLKVLGIDIWGSLISNWWRRRGRGKEVVTHRLISVFFFFKRG